MTDLTSQLRMMVTEGHLDMPIPGTGQTAQRLLALHDLARTRTVGLARLAEAHTDAVAICAEADTLPASAAVYGVWAAEIPGNQVTADLSTGTMTGGKGFCSGLGIIDHALVTCVDEDGRQVLVDVDVRPADTLSWDTGGWHSSALADTHTGQISFVGHPISQLIAGADFYLDRPGFWHGALGPAACWAGAATGLADAAEHMTGPDPHRLAHLGSMRSAAWAMEASLRHAGNQVDAEPDDVVAARYRALAARHTIERSCTDLLDHFSRSLGPRPFVGHAQVAQRYVDTHLYLRQDHAERDLQALAQLPHPGLSHPGLPDAADD
ncbi:MAG: hypothetical protein ACR2HR_02215 [Euzebya sp.]